MTNFYEVIKYDERLPLKAFVHSVNKLEMHWHSEVEILLVLQGSVNIRVGSDLYTLYENDLILINSNEIHNTSKTKENNIILALQINLDYFSKFYPGANNIRFNTNLLSEDKGSQEKLNIIRHYIAGMIWEINKKSKGYQFIIGSKLNLLAAYLINNYEFSFLEANSIATADEDIIRLQNILTYVDDNLERKITLQEIADIEHINSYYLSHFFKKKVGISFQEYLNTKRLDKAFNLMLNTNMTITAISHESGFSSTNYFNKIFKEAYNSLPSENRGEVGQSNYSTQDTGVARSRTYLDVNRNAVFKKLFTYLKPTTNSLSLEDIQETITESIFINLEVKKARPLINHWQKLTSFGRASEGLRKSWQEQLKEMQKEIGFEYIRFHGIFCDDMMICNLDDEGKIVYNWSYVNDLLDFFKEVDIKPFIELGFMPSELKSSNETVFWWKGNISPPKDINLWTDLVIEFIKHCINRYGQKQVETWYFEVWNEPDLEGFFWGGGKEEYFQFYKDTTLAIKATSKNLKVGGPAIVHDINNKDNWLEDFLVYCNNGEVPLDFVSLHIYPEDFNANNAMEDFKAKAKKGEVSLDLINGWNNRTRIYFDENHTINILNSANEQITKNLKHSPELHITEWNASAYNRNLIHDTSFVGTFIVDNVLKSIGKTDSLGYWTFTDLYEESKVDKSEFHGNFGLINKSGLKKPSYNAYILLSKLGREIVEQGEEYIITKGENSIQILANNYVYFDELFANGDISALTNTERYNIYKSKQTKEIDINIKGLNGKYKITRYQLNRDNGSVFDQWIRMGAPENMTAEEVNYLKGKSYPKIIVENRDIVEEYKEKMHIPVHGVELLVLEKRI